MRRKSRTSTYQNNVFLYRQLLPALLEDSESMILHHSHGSLYCNLVTNLNRRDVRRHFTAFWKVRVNTGVVCFNSEVYVTQGVSGRYRSVLSGDLLAINLSMEHKMTTNPKSRDPFLVPKIKSDEVSVMCQLFFPSNLQLKLVIVILLDIIQQAWSRFEIEEIL